MLFGAQFIAGIALLATNLVPDGKFEHNWPIVVLCWIGTVGSMVAFSCSYTATKELFPTPLRFDFFTNQFCGQHNFPFDNQVNNIL